MEYKVFSEECMQALAELKDREEIERCGVVARFYAPCLSLRDALLTL